MAHIRSQIRGAVTTAVTGLTTTGARVYESRVLPLGSTEMPCLCVYAREDSPIDDDGAMSGVIPPRHLVRQIELHIEGYAGADDGTLDVIAEEVETAVFGSAALRALVVDMRVGPTTLRVDGESSSLLGVVDLVFYMLYRAAEGAPGTAV